MYNPGAMQLSSMNWLNNNANDRPSFQAIIPGTFSTRKYQVFSMPQGLLFLERRDKAGSGGGEPNNQAIVMGAVLGGMVGACIAHAITSNSAPAEAETGLECLREEDLFELARTRKKSFVAKIDEIQSISIDAPGTWGRMFNDSSLAGWVTIRDRALGKVKMEIRDQASMSVAVDCLPRRFANRVFVNVAFDRGRTLFVPCRR
jgi:hypothetical protein